MIDPNSYLSTRVVALVAALCFIPIAVSLLVVPEAWWWRNYPGILFHLAIFFLVPKLDAPDWAKAAGYGWLVLDVQAGIMTLNYVPHAVFDYVRLGGHIFGGMWIMTVSLPGSLPVKITGITSGLCLFLFSFVSPFFPMTVLGPATILVVVWLGFIAAQNGVKSVSQMPLAGQPGYNL